MDPSVSLRRQKSANENSPLSVDQFGGRVFVGGRLYRAFVSESNAARCALALRELVQLDALPLGRP